MYALESVGLSAFQTIPKFRKYYDEAGNISPYWAWATGGARPQKTLMVDVFSLVLPERLAMCPMPKNQAADPARASAG